MLAIIKQRSKEFAEQNGDNSQSSSSKSGRFDHEGKLMIFPAHSNSAVSALSSSRSRQSHDSSSHSFIHRQNSDESSIYSSGTTSSMRSYKTKYEPQKSIHEEISYVFHHPIKHTYSRGHEIPEPRSPHQHQINDYTRPHTSGTKLPPCFSPIRPSERTKELFTRATSPVMLRHGRHIPVDMISIKYKYPLNTIAYEKPSTLSSNVKNASLPASAENILEETRFQSIAPFTKREFYQSMSTEQQHELAQRRRRKRYVTHSFPTQTPPFVLDYEKRGTKNATQRYVHKLYL